MVALQRADCCARLRQARDDRGLTHTAAAHQSGLCLQAYNKIERGRSSVTVATLPRFYLALGVSADSLLGLTETP